MTRMGALALAFALVAATLLAGCGLGAGSGAKGVSLTVTRDFGARTLGRLHVDKTAGSETVMRLLQRRFAVRTRYGGGFVDAIDGLGGGSVGGRPVDWFYYVNGIESSEGAADVRVHPRDRIWWDRHDWGTAMRVPAVVGSFPEPFRSGSGGKRLPVRVDCAPRAERSCTAVRHALEAVDVPVSGGALGAPAGTTLLRVDVGPWALVRRDVAVRQLERGPASSGVFARPAVDGGSIALLDQRGRVARRLGAGAGLIAATRYRGQQPAWVVTGTDAAGILAAAHALRPGVLRNRFALALDRGRRLALPERGS